MNKDDKLRNTIAILFFIMGLIILLYVGLTGSTNEILIIIGVFMFLLYYNLKICNINKLIWEVAKNGNFIYSLEEKQKRGNVNEYNKKG